MDGHAADSVNLDAGPRIVLQRVHGENLACEVISGIPVFRRALIRFAAGGPAASAECDQLYDAVREFLLSLSPEARVHPHPCGLRELRAECASIADPACLKVLVLAGNKSAPIPQRAPFVDWLRRGQDFSVLPVVPEADPFGTVVAWEPLSRQNAYRWTGRIGDAAPAVAALAGVAPEDNRIFVSYKRVEAGALAEQVFHSLAERGFDVFVDRFRVPPGVDFQRRLSDELAHKAMVLVLETGTILESRWVEHELSFAKKLGLGHLALHLPGGTRVPHIDDDFRVKVDADTDLVIAADGTIELKPDALARVVQRVVDEHARAHARRRNGLRTSLAAALARVGVRDQIIDQHGYLRVSVPDGAGVRRYAFWVTSRPADVEDFLVTHDGCKPAPCPTGVVLAPAGFEEPGRRRRTEWLADVSRVRIRSASELNALAEDVRAARL